LLIPKDYDAKQSYPIILYLHGAAGRGHDNAEPLNWGPMLFLDPSLREKHRFFLLVPQCPADMGWLQSSLGGLNGYKEGEALVGAGISQRYPAAGVQHRCEAPLPDRGFHGWSCCLDRIGQASGFFAAAAAGLFFWAIPKIVTRQERGARSGLFIPMTITCPGATGAGLLRPGASMAERPNTPNIQG